MLFGEWCSLVHSVKYDLLPDLFTAFDIFDRQEQRYVSAERRNAMLDPTGIRVVRPVACEVTLRIAVSRRRSQTPLMGGDPGG